MAVRGRALPPLDDASLVVLLLPARGGTGRCLGNGGRVAAGVDIDVVMCIGVFEEIGIVDAGDDDTMLF